MLYTDLQFTGEQIYKRRVRRTRERLKAASFTAWQITAAQAKDFPAWEEYVEKLGLKERVRNRKEDLKREADETLKKVEKMLERAKNGGR